MDMDILRLNAVLLEGFLGSTMEAVVVETAIAAAKSLVCSLLMVLTILEFEFLLFFCSLNCGFATLSL